MIVFGEYAMPAISEVAILSRIIEPDEPDLSPELARFILRWKFRPTDRKRMLELLEKAKAGSISRREMAEAEKYERVGHLVSMLKSKARVSLKSNEAN
jgi:hypothetical protein